MKEELIILIVEDSIIFSEGMELILLQHPRIKKVCIAHNFRDASSILDKVQVDIVFLDLNFETREYSGFSIARHIKQLHRDIKIIVLTQYARTYVYEKLFQECKVDAYLDKQLGANEAFKAIEMVMNDEIYINSNISDILDIEQWWKVSKREQEIVPFLVKGLTQKEIALQLNISARTVENHINSMMKKLEVKNSVELVAKYVSYVHRKRENLEGGLSPF